jgi:AcrR family transcriptional regulator
MTAAPRLSIREAQKELTRERFLDAAQTAFEESGYINVTIDDIIRRAGAARGTFYLYFDSKVAILRAVLDKIGLRESYRDLVVRRNAIENPSIEALQLWFEAYVDVYTANRAFHRAIHEARAIEPEFDKETIRDIEQDIEFWPLPGLTADADVEKRRLAAMMSYIKTEGILYLWLVQGLRADREKITRLLAEQAYSGQEAASLART